MNVRVAGVKDPEIETSTSAPSCTYEYEYEQKEYADEEASRDRNDPAEIRGGAICIKEQPKKLGTGAFGEVIKAKYHGSPVALKALHDTCVEVEFAEEAEILVSLRHTNIISFYGTYEAADRRRYLVFEYAPLGSVLNHLRENRDTITDGVLLHMATDTAKGMIYLAHEKILHRDLACRNLLLSASPTGRGFVTKVADFGRSKQAEQDVYIAERSRFVVPVKWTAIEGFAYDRFTMKSDVW